MFLFRQDTSEQLESNLAVHRPKSGPVDLVKVDAQTIKDHHTEST